MAITKDMLITDILEQDVEIDSILMQKGMHCIGCMAIQAGGCRAETRIHSETRGQRL